MDSSNNTITRSNATSRQLSKYLFWTLFVDMVFGLIFVLIIANNGSHAYIQGGEQIIEDRQGDLGASLALIANPKQTVHILDNLIKSIVYSSNDFGSAQKRGLDLGMTRGFSGSQAGKHLMGLSAASFANGPGK